MDRMQFQSRAVLMAMICGALVQTCRANSSSKDDEIKSLPGQPHVSFQQYAGYVAVDEMQQRALFYYFVEAETEPASKPLVLWLNGGPGCSSVGAGAFEEHGPFRPSDGGTLARNNYSWNKEANILYLESPAGVGFSFSRNTTFYQNVNDSIAAQDNLIFLQNWFLKFPEYKERDLYIAGESYAGHYVPQLAQLITQSGLNFSLKGIAIGNPLLDFDSDLNSEGDYYWNHGLISDETYKLLRKTCNTSQLQREKITGSVSAACARVRQLLSSEIPAEIDIYDVTSDVCLSSSGVSKLETCKYPFIRLRPRFVAPLQSLQKPSNQPSAAENIDLCIGTKVHEYLNRKDVQKSLHARLVGVASWTSCSSVLEYDYENLLIPTIGVVGSLVRSGIRVLVYSGDQDSVIPFLGSRTLVQDLAKHLGLNTTGAYRAWFSNQQVGGWTQDYSDILTFATIRGASHLAPYSNPSRSLTLFAAFIAGKPLAKAYN